LPKDRNGNPAVHSEGGKKKRLIKTFGETNKEERGEYSVRERKGKMAWSQELSTRTNHGKERKGGYPIVHAFTPAKRGGRHLQKKGKGGDTCFKFNKKAFPGPGMPLVKRR